MNQTKAQKEKKKEGQALFRFSLFSLGIVFLFLPNLNLFDLLPDAIGYAALAVAIRHAASAFPHFSEAYRGFYRLALINLAKLPALLTMMYISGINAEERGIITVFALGFAVVELIFAVPAFRDLFEGLLYVGQREGASATFYLDRGKGSADTLSLFTFIFLIGKGALSFLPECAFLSTFFYNGSLDPGAINPAAFYPFFAVIALLVGTVLGTVWLVLFSRYLRSLRTSEAFSDILRQKWIELLPTVKETTEKRKKRLLLLLFVGALVFTVDPVISDTDLLPDLFAALLLLGVFILAKGFPLRRFGIVVSALYGVAAVAVDAFAARFFEDFVYIDVLLRDAAPARFLPLLVSEFIKAALLILLFLLLARCLKQFIRENTAHPLGSVLPIDSEQVHRELSRRVTVLTVLGILYALFRPVSRVLMTLVDRHVITEDEANQFFSEGAVVYSSRFAWLWIAVLIFGCVLAAYAVSLKNDIKAEAYMDDEA